MRNNLVAQNRAMVNKTLAAGSIARGNARCKRLTADEKTTFRFSCDKTNDIESQHSEGEIVLSNR